MTFCCFGLFGPRQHGVATSHRVSRNNVTQDSTITCQLQVSKKQPWTAIAISGVCKFSFSSNFTLSGRGLRYKLDINLTGLKKKKKNAITEQQIHLHYSPGEVSFDYLGQSTLSRCRRMLTTCTMSVFIVPLYTGS